MGAPDDERTNDLFLLGELGLPNLVTAQDDIEDPLHVAEQLLVGSGGAALKVGDDGGRRVALCGEVLLGHGGALVVFGLGAGFGDGLADGGADRFGLDDVVGAVDLGQALAFGGSSLGGVRWPCSRGAMGDDLRH